MHLIKCILQEHTFIDLILCNAGQLCAEICQLGFNDWLNIGLENTLNSLSSDIDHHDWELDDLIEFQSWITLSTLCLKIIHANVIKWSLIRKSHACKV